MQHIPRHKTALLSDRGIHIRWLSANQGDERKPVGYVHRDDYYVFAMLECGCCRMLIDFDEHNLSAGKMVVIQPGQVHRLVAADDACGFVVMLDGSYIGGECRRILDEFSVVGSVLEIGDSLGKELHQLAEMIVTRADKPAKEVVRSLAEAFVGMVTERAGEICREHSVPIGRRMEMALAFRSLLKEEVYRNRQPSYYARRLNVSTVYLNEVVRSVTGMSASGNIQSEILLQAKRLLVHTDLSVKEIAARLGFDDNAYFSRLFTQAAGITPTTFRNKFLTN